MNATPPSSCLLYEHEEIVVRRTTLPCGLRVVTATMPNARSAAVEIWIRGGSRDDPAGQAGCSHLVNLVAFGGTRSRTAAEVAQDVGRDGGELNSTAARDYSRFYAATLPSGIPAAVDVLFDLVLNPVFDEANVYSEVQVVLEQIAENQYPTHMVSDEFQKDLFRDHPLGRPVMGTANSVRSISRETLVDWHHVYYRPGNLVLAAAGCVDHDDLVAQAVNIVADFPDAVRADLRGRPQKQLCPTASARIVPDKFTGQHIIMGTFGVPWNDSRWFAANLIDIALGNGKDSRLSRAIRAKRSAVVWAYSYHHSYEETGYFRVKMYSPLTELDEVLAICAGELDKMMYRGLSEEELLECKRRFKYSADLGLGVPSKRAETLGRNEILGISHLSPTEVSRRIDAVTSSDIRQVAADLFGGPRVLVIVGRDPGRDFSAFVT